MLLFSKRRERGKKVFFYYCVTARQKLSVFFVALEGQTQNIITRIKTALSKGEERELDLTWTLPDRRTTARAAFDRRLSFQLKAAAENTTRNLAKL